MKKPLQENIVYNEKEGTYYHHTPWEELEGPFTSEVEAMESLQRLSEELSIKYCMEKRHSLKVTNTDMVNCTACGRTYNLTAVLNVYLRRIENLLNMLEERENAE